MSANDKWSKSRKSPKKALTVAPHFRALCGPQPLRAAPGAAAERDDEPPALMSRVACGDRTAFWRLWQVYREYLYGVCLKQSRGVHEDAEDALSLVMIRAFDRLPAHAARITNLKAWLAKLARNLCVDLHRERNRRARFAESMDVITLADIQPSTAAIESPENILLHREMWVCINHAIEDLPPRLKEAFLLRVYQEMEYSEIAERLNLSEGNARKRIQQSRALIQMRLNEYLYELHNRLLLRASGDVDRAGRLDAPAARKAARRPKTNSITRTRQATNAAEAAPFKKRSSR